MFTVIIPTLWKSNYTSRLLLELHDCNLVGEIILIDNANDYKNQYDGPNSKINLVVPEENLYVNAAWNLGVKLAKYKQLAICNDDILFSNCIFNYMNGKLKYLGVVGQSINNYYNNNYSNRNIAISKIERRGYGYGCLMFIHSDNYNNIPTNLKIIYGDDWLLKHNKFNFEIVNFNVETEKMSTTSSLDMFNDIIENDIIEYQKIS